MIHFNVELWNINQLCVLQVLNEKEIIPTRKAEILAKAKMSRHSFKMSRHNLNRTSRSYVATKSVMSQQRSSLTKARNEDCLDISQFYRDII